MGKSRNKYGAESRDSQRKRKRFAMCEGKTRYPDAESAEQKGNHIYQCRLCKGWHRTGQAAALAAELRRNQRIGVTRDGRHAWGKEQP